jgi:biotin transport system substrate-specific component
VPLTLQPLAVLGVGLALGPVAGFLTMLAYLAEGALGLPVFSPTGPGGLLQLLGPTGGFLMSYPLAAFIAGGVAGTLATAVVFLLGASWFMHYTHNSLQAAWLGAVAPFLPGEAVKILAAAGIYSALSRSTRI